MSRGSILQYVRHVVAEETGQPEAAILESNSFESLGIDSLSAIVILNKIEDQYQFELNPLDIWDHPTVGAFTDFVAARLSDSAQ
ncbi:MAG TPA: acyl carrier protein [Cyclobacteriaceae bacterium]|nr:acyl carrier protein [Cyclobacteriaceae bacterium]